MKTAVILSVLSLVTSCQQATFDAEAGGGNQPVIKTAVPPVENPTPMGPINPDEVFKDTPDDQAMRKCFVEWGDAPFGEAAAKSYRIMTAQGTGFGAREVADKSKSKTNNLVLIKVDVVGFSSVILDLGNPNGWYCIASSATGFSNLKIKKHCKATIGGVQNSATGFTSNATAEYGDDC
jgi:hypothetical protein